MTGNLKEATAPEEKEDQLSDSSARHMLREMVAELRNNFNNNLLMPLAERKKQLNGIQRMLEEHQQDFEQALYADLGKPAFESFMTEIAIVQREARDASRQLESWAAPARAGMFFPLQPATAHTVAQPLGLVLIIAPWNYPLQLSLMPVIGAIAAGNCVVLKPSELAQHTSNLLARLLPEYVSRDYLRVVEGAVDETTVLLNQRFDHIFFTGSEQVGRIVRKAAAYMDATCTLELGGKCPCIVDENVNLAHAAENIVWGKFLNAGQTCIAPDYVLVNKNLERELLDEMKKVLLKFYGEDPSASPDYGRIINRKHYDRLMELMQGDGIIVAGGKSDPDKLYIAPTILSKVPRDAHIMDDWEEIFGPVLPVLSVESVADAVAFIRRRPEPLAIYLFSKEKNTFDYVAKNTRSGALSVNATIVHGSVPSLPFGGVGASGCGQYHGKYSFDTFSYRRAIFKKATWPDPSAALTHPPYTDFKKSVVKRVM